MCFSTCITAPFVMEDFSEDYQTKYVSNSDRRPHHFMASGFGGNGSTPTAVVIMAKIIWRTDSSTTNGRTIDFNAFLRELSDDRRDNNPDNRLILVDQYNALRYSQDIGADGIHPKTTGYRKMADVWYDDLVTFLPPLNEPSPPANGG
jgi:hypothetical protein